MNRTTIRAALVLAISGIGVTLAQDAGAPGGAAAPKVVHTPKGVKIQDSNGVAVSRFDTVTLNVKDADLASVLELLAIQGQRNIVPSPKVSGRVTANLYDVTFYEALDAILQQNAAGYIEKGDFIYVYTNEELKKIREAERKQVHRVFNLNYLTAADASTFVTPLLSSNGKISLVAPVQQGFQPTIQDAGANSNAMGEVLLVRDFPEHVNEISKIISDLDTPPSQVLIESTVLSAKLTEDLAFGVDISLLYDVGFSAGDGSPFGVINSMLDGDTNDMTPLGTLHSTVGNVADGKGGVKVGIMTNNVAVFIRALDEVTDTTILANPKVMTLNRQKAEVLVGTKVAYLSTTATATATTQTVEYLDTGTQLTVRPFVSKDGVIRLELKPRVSSFELRDSFGGGGAVTLPDETIQELVTNVMVRDGQTVVLGGLFQEQTTITRRQVPGLGDIPIAGWAFKGKDDNVVRNEVIFLVTPHVVKEKSLAVAGDSVMEDIEMLRVGTREHLLPWSRSRQTAGHVRDALRNLELGDRDKALYEVNKALRLDPQMTEARRLKEKLTGQREYTPTDGLMQEAIDMVLDQQVGHRKREQVDVVPETLPALPQRPEGFDPHHVPPPYVPRSFEPFNEASGAPEAAPGPGPEVIPAPAPDEDDELKPIEPPEPPTAEDKDTGDEDK